MDDPDPRQTPQLLSRVLQQFTTLLRGEMQLAQLELSQNLSRAGIGLAMIFGAAILALVAMNTLAAALVGALAGLGLAPGAAALLVGIGLLLLAAGLAMMGLGRANPRHIPPARSMRNLARDVDRIKESLRHG